MKNTKLTSVKILKHLYDSFKIATVNTKMTLQKITNRSVHLYMNDEKTNILIGSNRHWRTINKTLCTFMLSKNLLNKYWENFYKTCLDRHDPFEKYINEIYENEVCISPVKSLSLHLTNINSSYGLSPFLDYKKLWEDNK